jgi:hypothetical protein
LLTGSKGRCGVLVAVHVHSPSTQKWAGRA